MNHNVSAFAREPKSHGAAQALGGAGDERDAIRAAKVAMNWNPSTECAYFL